MAFENYSDFILITLTAVAAFFSALAASLAYLVSRNSLRFQKSYSKNQNLINRINLVIYDIRTLRKLISNTFLISDEKFESINPMLLGIQAELESLEEINVFKYSLSKLSRITSPMEVVALISENDTSLSDAINELEKKINEIFI